MSTAVDLKTKEEKDADLDRRIEALRKKNEALMRRYQEIEEDKKKAEQEGVAVTTTRKPRSHEPEVDRRRMEKENFTVTVDLSRPSMEKRMVNDRKQTAPRGEHGSEGGGSPPRRTGSGRVGRGGQRGSGGGGPRSDRREQRPDRPAWEAQAGERTPRGPWRGGRGGGGGGGGGGGSGGSGGGGGGNGGGGGGGGGTGTPGMQGGPGSDRKSKEWEEKRRQNIEKMNEEMEKIAEYERSQKADGEKNPIRNFLDDPRRSGPIPEVDRKEGSRRHVRNWGGLDFDNVKTGAEMEKEWTSRRPGGRGSVDMTLSMTGRERAEYLSWKREREQIDEERLARHRNATGQWRREWDAQKTDTMFKEEPAVGGEGMPETSGRRARGRSARAQQRSGASEDGGKRPPKAPTFGDFLGQGKPREGGRPGRGRGRGRGQPGKSYSMHDNRWEGEKDEEKGKREETEQEKDATKPEAPSSEKAEEKEKREDADRKPASGVVTEEEEDEEWEDASDGEDVEDDDDSKEEEQAAQKRAKPTDGSPVAPPGSSSLSPKEQRTARPKVHIPSPTELQAAADAPAKPLSPFSPLDGHQPVTDWGEEMEMLSPRSSLGESPMKPGSEGASPAQGQGQGQAQRQGPAQGSAQDQAQTQAEGQGQAQHQGPAQDQAQHQGPGQDQAQHQGPGQDQAQAQAQDQGQPASAPSPPAEQQKQDTALTVPEAPAPEKAAPADAAGGSVAPGEGQGEPGVSAAPDPPTQHEEGAACVAEPEQKQPEVALEPEPVPETVPELALGPAPEPAQEVVEQPSSG